MNRTVRLLPALLCAALSVALPVTALAATSAGQGSASPPTKADVKSKPGTTAAKPRAKASAPSGQKTAAATTTRKTGARPNGRNRTGGAPGDLVAADGIVEAECYRLTRGKGRCEPQCLPYTRCRSGISSCRIGHENGPVTWFNCEQARGNTSLQPADGRVLVLGRNAHNMSTGHTLYVEKALPRSDGRYDLVLSHTNYDRRCNLETNMRAEYDPIAKTIDVRSGKWEQWGRELKVAGFIHD
jgi:hypothetical protein